MAPTDPAGVSLFPPATLWTIGHSTHPIAEFLGILRSNGITDIADVRRFPGSRKHPQFNPEPFERALAADGIGYAWLPELGGRRTPLEDSPHSVWRNPSFRGYADYMDTPAFAAAAGRLAHFARDRRAAIMCAEGVWWRCHRSMIADFFSAHGWQVLHILGTATPKPHPLTAPARIVDGKLTY